MCGESVERNDPTLDEARPCGRCVAGESGLDHSQDPFLRPPSRPPRSSNPPSAPPPPGFYHEADDHCEECTGWELVVPAVLLSVGGAAGIYFLYKMTNVKLDRASQFHQATLALVYINYVQVFNLIASFPGFELPSLFSVAFDLFGNVFQLDFAMSLSLGAECAGAPSSFFVVWLGRVLGPLGAFAVLLLVGRFSRLDFNRMVSRLVCAPLHNLRRPAGVT